MGSTSVFARFAERALEEGTSGFPSGCLLVGVRLRPAAANLALAL